MATSARALIDILVGVTQGKIRAVPFWQWVVGVSSTQPEAFSETALLVISLCELVEQQIALVSDLPADDRGHYRIVLGEIANAFVPPVATAEAPQVVSMYLNRNILALLSTMDREISRAGVERSYKPSEIDSVKAGIAEVVETLASSSVDKSFASFMNSHLSRVAQALSAYQDRGAAFLDRIIKSFIADISTLHASFADESDEARIMASALKIFSVLGNVIPTTLKLLAAVQPLQLPPPNA